MARARVSALLVQKEGGVANLCAHVHTYSTCLTGSVVVEEVSGGVLNGVHDLDGSEGALLEHDEAVGVVGLLAEAVDVDDSVVSNGLLACESEKGEGVGRSVGCDDQTR